MEEKVTTFSFARVKSTFRRRLPARPLIGPIFRPIHRADEDDVALVSLDVLQVLDEELLQTVVLLLPIVDVSLDVRMARACEIELFEDQVTLLLVQRDYSQRPLRLRTHEVDGRIDHHLRLYRVSARFVSALDALILYPHPSHRLCCGRKHDQVVVVYKPIGELYQARVPRTVMPSEAPGRTKRRVRHFQDGLVEDGFILVRV